MKVNVLFVIFCFLFTSLIVAECKTEELKCTLRYENTFKIKNQNLKQSLSVLIYSVTLPKGSPWKNSDEVLVVSSSDDEVLFKKIYKGTFEERNRFHVFKKDITSSSNALLIIREHLPSAPMTGIEGQLYSVDKSNNLIPISGVIYPSTDEINQDIFKITNKNVSGKDNLIVETDFWNGNFFVTYYFPISFDGKISELSEHFKANNYPIKIDTEKVLKYRKIFLKKKKTIFLYPEPGASKELRKKLKIDIRTKIKFIDAAKFDNKWWLQIEVDGFKGYVKGSKTFARLGLPSAG